MNTLEMIRVASITPRLHLGQPEKNAMEIIITAKEASSKNAGIILFPELCLTGSTCGDLFFHDHLYQAQLNAISHIIDETKDLTSTVILGCYLSIGDKLYSCAMVIHGGKILGVVPQLYPSKNASSYGRRPFSSYSSYSMAAKTIGIFGETIPFGPLIFHCNHPKLSFGIEIGEDIVNPISPGTLLALRGAQIIFSPSANSEGVCQSDFRKSLLSQSSIRNSCAYVLASSGVHESTTDSVFGGHNIIMEKGETLAESTLFNRDSSITYGDIDFGRINFQRLEEKNAGSDIYITPFDVETIEIDAIPSLSLDDPLLRTYSPKPFVPEDLNELKSRCSEIFNIQTASLAKRFTHINSENLIIGISGGLDSTLALLVCAETFKLLGKNPNNIIAVTMPGFGTSDTTYENAKALMSLLDTSMKEISIKDAVLQHFNDIGQDPKLHDITYENSQARERTQILMDIANQKNGLVVGTGDLSEIALGWSTFNGDHMSMYNVNGGVPKTLIPSLISWFIQDKLWTTDQGYSKDDKTLVQVLNSVIATPISPELLPLEKDGTLAQKTEGTVGPYILHDFFLYYTQRFGMAPKKLLSIAERTFRPDYSQEEILKWLKLFYKRFFTQQFKRNCSPEGPAIGSVSLSPRGGWTMPSDMNYEVWLKSL